ncbi:MAG: short-chain dehydrogenase, partial [Deltaproteobacteria bacterium CG17_big_fil_post_rev_8_21_14_2_50_51_6]
MESFQDKVAVITGGASGIGAAIALALAREGCHIAIMDADIA